MKNIILSLGSNVSDRLSHLRLTLTWLKALSTFKLKQVSPLYISDALLPDNAPSDWDMPYINVALTAETSSTPEELLKELKNIEWSIGRKPEVRHWGPRIIDIDILAYDDLVIDHDELTVPRPNLIERPFALWPLLDLVPNWVFPLPGPHQGKRGSELANDWGSRFTGKAPFRTRQIYQRIDTPACVGVLNITPNSFSDGGAYTNIEDAIQQAISLIHQGAEILDIGAESTAPDATKISMEVEWGRLEPILQAIKEERDNFLIDPKISVDTYHPEVALKASQLGIDWINDVKGLSDQPMRRVLSETMVKAVMMHSLSIPANRDATIPLNEDPVHLVYEWGAKQLSLLEKEGIDPTRIIFDPGIGFGKTANQSFELIKNAGHFKKLGLPVLIGHSRKSFMSLFTHLPPENRDLESAIISLYLADQSVDYLRLHNIEMSARAFRVNQTLRA